MKHLRNSLKAMDSSKNFCMGMFAKTRRAFSLLTPTLLVASLLMTSNSISALGLGTIRVDSKFGESFSATIEVYNKEGFDEGNLSISLASREVHEQMGIYRSPYLDGLQVALAFRESGTTQIIVQSPAQLNEPYLEFAVEMRWPEGRLVRDYTVLLSMPSITTPLASTAVQPQQKASTAVESPKIPTPKQRDVQSVPHSSLYSVQSGDTLSEIAERIEDREVSLYSAIRTLEAHNAKLLNERGARGLEVGDKIRVPAKEVFSLPASPIRPAVNKTNSTADTSAIGSPLARAETRLRALGYANLQTRAAGETPNPVVASGAAAEILNDLIAEQGNGEASVSSAQVSRLADGLNEIADISREYQSRLAALEAAAQEQARTIEELRSANAQLSTDSTVIDSVGASTKQPSTPVVIESSSSRIDESRNTRTAAATEPQSIEKPTSGTFWVWWTLLVVLTSVICAFIFFKIRRQNVQHAIHEPYFDPNVPIARHESDLVEERTDAQKEVDSKGSPEDSQKEHAANLEDELEHDTEIDDSAPQDLDAVLDEELRLIQIFESNLASENAVRSSLIQEQDLEDSLAEASVAKDTGEDERTPLDEEEILELTSEPETSESSLEFVLEEGFDSTDDSDLVEFEDEFDWGDEDAEYTLEAALSETDNSSSDAEGFDAPAELKIPDVATDTSPSNVSLPDSASSETPIETTSLEEAVSAPHFGSKGAGSNAYSAYAEASGFDQINPVEVIEIVGNKLDAAKEAGKESTFFYIEIDQFAQVEKELGIVKAEKLAAVAASNIYDRIENPITLKRFRQDGFVLLLSGGQNQQNLQFAQELAAAIASSPLEVTNETFFVTLSIGVVPVSSSFSNSAEVIEAGRSMVEKVRHESDEGIGNGAMLHKVDPTIAFNEASVIRAGQKLLSDGAFQTVYQPITALKGDPLEFYEAKLRISPDAKNNPINTELIDRLSNTDLSTEIDCLNFNQALSDLKRYLDLHLNTRIFVAISARTATDNFFKNWFEKTVFSEGIHPERIVIQMPEHSASRHLNSLIAFRDYAHNLGARICISHLNFQHIPENAMARLHPDFVQIDATLSEAAQHSGTRNEDADIQRRGVENLTDVLEKARPLCEKIIVPSVSHARIIPTLWPLAVDYIQGDYIHQESLRMDYEFDQAAE